MLVREYTSLTELLADSRDNGCGEHTNTNWAGGTLAEAYGLATNGWPEGAQLAQASAFRMADRLVAGTASGDEWAIECDVAGAAYDPGAYYSGTPECWARPTVQPMKRAIHIVTNICVSGGVSPHTIQTRGLAVAALTLALTSRGYPVTVDVQLSASTMDVRVRVIDATSGSQVDVDRLVYAMAHPTMFRQLLHSVTHGRRHGNWPDQVPKDRIPNAANLYLGGAHLNDVERWQDGGEAWILTEYTRQTAEA